MTLLSSGSFAGDFIFKPNGCGGELGGGRPVEVRWQMTNAGETMQTLAGDNPEGFLREAAHRSDLMVVLHFPDTAGAGAASTLFNHLMRSVGFPEGTEEPLGGGITSEFTDGFLPGFYRDANGDLVAGTDNHDHVRALDILLTPASPEHRAVLLGAIRPR